LAELEREMARATRTGQPLVLAFTDVDQVKAVNDAQGHAAGDRLLVAVVAAFRAKLRAHDLIIRYGGDEFLCAISGLDLSGATARLALVHSALAQGPEDGAVTIGLATAPGRLALHPRRARRRRAVPRGARPRTKHPRDTVVGLDRLGARPASLTAATSAPPPHSEDGVNETLALQRRLGASGSRAQRPRCSGKERFRPRKSRGRLTVDGTSIARRTRPIRLARARSSGTQATAPSRSRSTRSA
jgi:hypothetical protein